MGSLLHSFDHWVGQNLNKSWTGFQRVLGIALACPMSSTGSESCCGRAEPIQDAASVCPRCKLDIAIYGIKCGCVQDRVLAYPGEPLVCPMWHARSSHAAHQASVPLPSHQFRPMPALMSPQYNLLIPQHALARLRAAISVPLAMFRLLALSPKQ